MIDEDVQRYLIWSNEQGAWWRPGKQGYTRVIGEAGRYNQHEARAIVDDAGQGTPAYVPHKPEVMVPAPPDQAALVVLIASVSGDQLMRVAHRVSAALEEMQSTAGEMRLAALLGVEATRAIELVVEQSSKDG